MSGRVRGVVGSLLTLAALVGVLALVDDRVRDRLSDVTDGVSPASSLTAAITDAARSQPLENFYMVSFVVVGIVLVYLMLRT